MARLKVRLRGKTVTDVSLAEDRQYIAGRKDEADIVLQAEKGISREHFRLSLQNGEWTVEVISRYGDVLVNGEKQQSFTLEHGSMFAIPPYEFEFSASAAAAPMEVTNTSNLPVVSSEAGSSDDFANDEKTVIGVAPVSAYIKFVDSNQETKELIRLEAGDSWVAGRDSTCSILIRDQRVSRRQFEIRKVGNSYHIVELGSVNGTLLNGNPLSSSEPTVLKSGDSISVLDNYLYFELHDPHFRSKMEVVSQQPVPSSIALVQDGTGMTHEIMPYNGTYGVPGVYHPQVGQTPPQLAPELQNKKFDFQKHRPKIIAGAVIFLLLMFLMKGEDKPANAPSGVTAPGSPAEIFNKLKPEQQALVRQRYKDAKNMYMQGKYELAQQEIMKIYEIVPDYEDLKEIDRLAKEAIFIQEQKRRQEELEKARAEAEEKIQKQVVECQKLVKPDVVMEKIEECLSSVLQYNPEHAKILELRAQVEGLITLREAKDAERAAYNSQVSKLRGMYEKAQSIQQTGNPLDAIAAFERVVSSRLPDPKGLRSQSERNIASIRQQMNSKTATLQTEADQAAAAGNLKSAILALRKARQIDPQNPDLVEKIQRHTMELRKQMMTLYQEGILEESFGNVEGGEARAGAKEKWKKILQLDISDGEYYKKAYIKLKKYGAL